MEEKTLGCLKQTAIGCGVLIVIAIALPFVLGVMMMGPFKRAVDTRLAIEEQFGPQEAYVPPASGAPSADRIEVFLGIRRGFTAQCTDLTRADLSGLLLAIRRLSIVDIEGGLDQPTMRLEFLVFPVRKQRGGSRQRDGGVAVPGDRLEYPCRCLRTR